MTSLTADHQVLKADTRGRVQVPAARREALLDEFERSSLSAVKFAALAGVKYATFAGWAHQRRKTKAAVGQSAPAAATAPELAPPARVTSPAPLRLWEAFVETGPGLLIELPGGATLRVEAPGQLRLVAELLGLLAQTTRPVC